MSFDLDKYYTPAVVADEIIALAPLEAAPSICIDPTCGSGRLLEAAVSAFEDVRCVGLDRDRGAIARLRRRRPDWSLHVADLLTATRRDARESVGGVRGSKLLLLNPPFTHGKRKAVAVSYGSSQVEASAAMAYVLRSLEIFRPSLGAIAIVPESLIYSEIDAHARELISAEFQITHLLDLAANTFSGARARTAAIRIGGRIASSVGSSGNAPMGRVHLAVGRGSVPVHRARFSKSGIKYLHSVDIRTYLADRSTRWKVSSDANYREVGRGWRIFFPRVGVPSAIASQPVYVDEPMVLSDCVVQFSFASRDDAFWIRDRIRDEWRSFEGLYRGTGARYVTISRLSSWLSSIGGLVR